MRDLSIAYGDSRQAKHWVNKKICFDDLKKKLKVSIPTPETVEEYARMSKAARDQAKDHGGFVGGSLIGGRRKVDTVACRSMISLDGDRIIPEFLDSFEDAMPFAAFLYTTHSSTPENPRVRIIVPLTRDVTPEEFVAVSRYLAEMLGIDYFDECSYLPNQLMYWPSTPMNGVYIWKEVNKGWLDPDVMLIDHPDWQDPARLPTSSRESRANTVTVTKAQDPLTKDGIVGVFNRAFFPIQKALDTFLPEVYEPTASENRYHLIASHSMAGVEVIEDKFVYSHHAKDPAYMRLCNAFDIVRIHKFGDEDDKASFMDMCKYALSLEVVKYQMTSERFREADVDSTESVKRANMDWTSRLTYEPKSGRLANTLQNLSLILENDQNLRAIVFNMLADSLEINGIVPWKHPGKFWRDADDAQLVSYIDSHYGTFSARNYEIAVTKVADDRSYHPIRKMFEALPPWDGIPRVDTLLIDYLGAQDNPYVRAVTRKALCAAWNRVYHPGIKFDYMIVLNGDQGIGKSTLIAKLGMDWFSDSLALSDMNDKTAAEKLQGYWILEIGELAGMKKADIDKVKAFVSRQDDKYRASYGHHVTPHLRQCIFFGTTNSENGYLRDITGNRRFWNVRVTGNGKWKPWDLDDVTIQMIWAEAKLLAESGEPLFLSPDLESFAKVEQARAMEQDDREGIVAAYLDMLQPLDWYSMSVYDRSMYFRNPDNPTRQKGVNLRNSVCNMEIWCECFGKNKEDMHSSDSYAISAIMVRMPGWVKASDRQSVPGYGQQRVYVRAKT